MYVLFIYIKFYYIINRIKSYNQEIKSTFLDLSCLFIIVYKNNIEMGVLAVEFIIQYLKMNNWINNLHLSLNCYLYQEASNLVTLGVLEKTS